MVSSSPCPDSDAHALYRARQMKDTATQRVFSAREVYCLYILERAEQQICSGDPRRRQDLLDAVESAVGPCLPENFMAYLEAATFSAGEDPFPVDEKGWWSINA